MAPRLFLLPLFLILFLISHDTGHAQAASAISGKVLTSDGEPVAGAAVEILGTSPRLGSFARADGSYRIRTVRPGSYRLRIFAPGYIDDTVDVTVESGSDLTMGLSLAPAPHVAREKDYYTSGGDFDGLEMAATAEGGGALMARGAPKSAATMGRGSLGIAADGSASAAPPPASRPLMAGYEGSVDAHAATATRPAPTDGGSTEGGDIPKPGEPSPRLPERPGQLTAGEWCDLQNWKYWLEVAHSDEWKAMPAYWGFDPSSRISVVAVDGDRLVADAAVTMTDGQTGTVWRARTDNRGRAELFVGVAGKPAGTYRIEVRSGDAVAYVNNVSAPSSGPVIAKLREAAAAPNVLDLMFVIDCTGSMGDELNYIKSELESVIDRVRDNHSDRIGIRISANFYRDRGDEYVVRSFPFTESAFEAIGHIRDQSADNGGDFPEAVEEALEDGIENHAWSPSAKARLMFLVLDAPPHYDEERVKKLQSLAKRAAEKGIRVIPVASSGVDKETEFLMRLFAIYSGGTYTFLTDDSGIGGSHLKPTIGRTDVEYLDDLMVRLIGRWVEDVTMDETLRAALR